jgi:hypothetical protein
MPIFTNNTTFPFDKFRQYDNMNLSSYENIESTFFTPEKSDLRKDIIKLINYYERQHLFHVLMDRVILMIFNESFEKIKDEEVLSTSISNKREFLKLINFRINLKKIYLEIENLENNENVHVNQKKLINDLVLFTYKFLYVEFSKLIYCQLYEEFEITLDLKKNYKTYLKYKSKIDNKKYNEIDYVYLKEFVENFTKSFNTSDINEIKATIDELLLYSNRKKTICYLNKIIEDNIKINSNLSATKKNKILIPFYKLITSEFFYKENLKLDINESELIEKFKKFRQIMNK